MNGVRLTNNDRKLIQLITDWGYLTIKDICIFFGYKTVAGAYWRVKRLTESGILKCEKSPLATIFHCGDFRGIDLALFDHNQILKKLAFKLSKDLSCNYKTLRNMRSESRQKNGVMGLTEKIPDLILVNESGFAIAIELELTQKSMQRQRKNIEKYISDLANNKYRQVFYYCKTHSISDRIKYIATEKGVQNKILSSVLSNDEVNL